MQALLTFTIGFNPLLVFLASFINKKSQWKISTLDWICGALAVVGIILWYITKVGNLAIFFSIIADGLAGIPTVIKSFHTPESEDLKVFILGALNGAITLLTIKIWNFAHYAFPAYIFLIDIIFLSLIKFKLGKKLSSLF